MGQALEIPTACFDLELAMLLTSASPWHCWDVVCASHCHTERCVNIAPPFQRLDIEQVSSHTHNDIILLHPDIRKSSLFLQHRHLFCFPVFFFFFLFDIVLPYHTCKDIILATQLWLQVPRKRNTSTISMENLRGKNTSCTEWLPLPLQHVRTF